MYQRASYQQYSWWWHESWCRIDGPEIPHSCQRLCLPFHLPLLLQQATLEQGFFVKCTSGTGSLSSHFLQPLVLIMLANFIEKHRFNRCRLMRFVLQLLFYRLPISIRPFDCHLLGFIQVHLKMHSFYCSIFFCPVNSEYPLQQGVCQFSVFVTDGILWPIGHPLWPLQSSTFSVLKYHILSAKIVWVDHLVLWGIHHNDFVG